MKSTERAVRRFPYGPRIIVETFTDGGEHVAPPVRFDHGCRQRSHDRIAIGRKQRCQQRASFHFVERPQRAHRGFACWSLVCRYRCLKGDKPVVVRRRTVFRCRRRIQRKPRQTTSVTADEQRPRRPRRPRATRNWPHCERMNGCTVRLERPRLAPICQSPHPNLAVCSPRDQPITWILAILVDWRRRRESQCQYAARVSTVICATRLVLDRALQVMKPYCPVVAARRNAPITWREGQRPYRPLVSRHFTPSPIGQRNNTHNAIVTSSADHQPIGRNSNGMERIRRKYECCFFFAFCRRPDAQCTICSASDERLAIRRLDDTRHATCMCRN